MNRKLVQYQTLLKQWNKKMNLISYTSDDELRIKHIWDCAFGARALDRTHRQNILDIGTGGGLPGIVLAIMLPHSDFTLLDSTQKKIRAVEDMRKQLDLKNVKCVWGHTSELARDTHFQEMFDVVTARAVAPLSKLLRLCVPFMKKNGILMAYKGPSFKEELQKADQLMKRMHVKLQASEEYDLPEGLGKRVILLMRKSWIPDPERPRRARASGRG